MKKRNKLISLLLAGVLLLGLLPVLAPQAEALSEDKGQYIQVTLGYGSIGNGDCKDSGAQNDPNNGFAPGNLFNNFRNNVPGFTYNGNLRGVNGDGVVSRSTQWGTFTVTMANNALLTALSQSTTAQYKVYGYVETSDRDWHTSKAHYDYDQLDVSVKDKKGGTETQRASAHSARDEYARAGYDTGWQSLFGVDQIIIHFSGYIKGGYHSAGEDAHGGCTILIQDPATPTLQSYVCTNGATVNSENSKELLVKLGVKNADDPDDYYYAAGDYSTDAAAMSSREWIDLQFNFSKPVSMASPNNSGVLQGVGQNDFETLASHDLFTNTLGTGYLNQGKNRGLELYKAVTAKGEAKGSADGGRLTPVTLAEMNNYVSSISYRYVATYGDFNGNHAITDGGGIETRNSYGVSLLQKLYNAGFHDAAGNPLTMPSGNAGKNIFDKNDGGYDVIVDAVPPTYSRVGNGITPDILTQTVLNENDTVDFIVSFSEAAITKRGWDNTQTYLMLDNGDKAYFREKSADGKQWIFRYLFQAGAAEEASLLKVIALGNDALDGSLQSGSTGKQSRSNDSAYTFNVDGRTITDYVGNVLAERANEDSGTNTSQIESSTSWAGIAVDNTAPEIAFSYSIYGTGTLSKGTDSEWGQAAKVLASASDPDVSVAKYDPDYSGSNQTRPSKGIYRPDNTTGSTASAVGLVFYIWTRSVTPPSTGDNFEAIKRYSLTGVQPRLVTNRPYASAWAAEQYNLMMANNFSDIVPPDAAMTGDGDGAWYLHVWTADMTWDTARQLMQYQKANAIQYNGGFDNAKFLSLKADAIEAYRMGDSPSYKTAWSAVMAEVYSTIYTAQFLDWLDEGSGGRYADAAMESALAKADAAVEDEVQQYQSGESAETLATKLEEAIAGYMETNKPSDEEAEEAVRNSVYATVYADEFRDALLQFAYPDETDLSDKVYPNSEEARSAALEAVIYQTGYDESSTETLKSDQISAYKTAHPTTGTGDDAHTTTDDEAWAAVRSEVYKTAYTQQFLMLLLASGEDVYSDDALSFAKDRIAYNQKDEEEEPASGGDASQGDDSDEDTPLDENWENWTTELSSTAQFYSASDLPTLTSEAVKAYQDEHPTRAEAEIAVTKGVYEAVYTAQFVAWLVAANGDAPYTEANVNAVFREKTAEARTAIIYAAGYDEETAAQLKSEKIQGYITANTKSAPKDPTPDYDTSWNAVKETVYSTAYTAQFLSWLDESGSDRYSDAAMLYARTQTMLQLADYANTEVWYLTDFTRADSNWTLQTARLLLDNTAPLSSATYQTENIIGDGTAAVELPFAVSDALSGIDTNEVYYQWVLKKNDNSQTYDDVQWLQVVPDATEPMTNKLADDLDSPNYGAASVVCTAKTLGNVIENGTYILYLKYSDKAGNTTITNSGSVTVTVDTENGLICGFGPTEAVNGWANAVEPSVLVKGVEVAKLTYTITDSITRPGDGFVELQAETHDRAAKAYTYRLPALSDSENQRADGNWYVHILIYENSDQTVAPHYYRQLYRLDRTLPEIIINPDGFSQFAQDTVDAAITVSDLLSGLKEGTVYRISAEREQLDAEASGWLALPEDGRVTLSAEEEGSYYLHVRASDQAGNTAYRVSGAFSLRGTAAPSTLPPYSCQILTSYSENGRTYAVANLGLETEDKAGYRYSISTNGGETWCNWLPYMSMIRMKLPETYGSDTLQVKFRAPDGTVGTPKNISTRTVTDAIWATAEFDSTFRRQSGKTLTLLMNLPEDVVAVEKVEDGEDARTTKLESGNFTLTANGVYAFSLTRGTQTAASDFVVVVDVFDDTPPAGYISYSDLAPTNGSVIATVKADEPIYVKALTVTYAGETAKDETPKLQFSFQKNGTAIFTIVDEAGNESTVTAAVSNIDTDAPNVRISANYDLYATVGAGDDLIASGATLEVRKSAPREEDFVVVSNDRIPTMEIDANGEYSFIVQDRVGNVTQVHHVVSNIVTTLPDYAVTYTYEDGSPVTAGEWKQGKVVATVTFQTITDGRKLYGGAAIVDEDRDMVVWNEATNSGETVKQHVSNELGKLDEHYIYTRTYTANGETALVVCDSLGNVERIPISVTGLDNTAPKLTLNKPTAVISNDQQKQLSQLTEEEITELFGGYVVTDNAYTAGFIVTVARSDDASKTSEADKGKLDEVGKFTLIYTVQDPAGNISYTEQTLIVIPSDGLLIEAGSDGDFALLSSLSANSSILPDNHVTFRIDQTRMQNMFYNNYGKSDADKKVSNSEMRYDIFYVSGLYREGQMKTIATQLTSEQLTAQSFQVTFPKAGWYTIIIRNQERTREYTTFFIAATSN